MRRGGRKGRLESVRDPTPKRQAGTRWPGYWPGDSLTSLSADFFPAPVLGVSTLGAFRYDEVVDPRLTCLLMISFLFESQVEGTENTESKVLLGWLGGEGLFIVFVCAWVCMLELWFIFLFFVFEKSSPDGFMGFGEG